MDWIRQAQGNVHWSW